MQDTPEKKIYIALVHHPVLSKKGDVICSAVTNLDIHDIARAARTFCLEKYYIVTTLQDQKILVDKILKHWIDGPGGDVNPDRREALQMIRVVSSIKETVAEIEAKEKKQVTVIATTAKKEASAVTFAEMKGEIQSGGVFLLLFGTAWGLSTEVFDSVDRVLAPIEPVAEYNHLSVRSAVSIVLDRLISEEGYLV